MEALVSGRAGMALVFDKGRVAALYADRPTELLDCPDWKVRRLLREAKDLQPLEEADLAGIGRELALVTEQAEALHTALILLDETLTTDTRQTAAEDLEELFARPEVRDHVECVLCAHPFPDGADLLGALACCTAGTAACRAFLQTMAALQSSIAEVRSAWNRIPTPTFGYEDDRIYAEATCIREGVFRSLVRCRANGLSLDTFRSHVLVDRTLHKLKNHQAILQKWTSHCRIEEEIERVLARYPGIREAVVIAREDVPDDRRLVAYLLPNAGRSAPNTAEVRDFLQHTLPEHMVPTTFVTLESMPRNINGKVDRHALADLEPEMTKDLVALRTLTEERLASIWGELLGLERVCLHDDFFDLGGQSLLAVELASRVHEVFGVKIPLHALCELPIANLAVELKQRRIGRSEPAPFRSLPRPEELPLSFAQERLWFIDQLDPGSGAYNISAGVRLEGPLEVATLVAALGEVVRRHENLRTVFVGIEGRPSQRIEPWAPFASAVVDLAGLQTERREETMTKLAREEAGRPFDLTRDRMVRWTLLKLDEETYFLDITFHHIAADGWSVEIFIRETASLYETFAQGRPSPLPELAIQYADFAIWQRKWLRGEVLEEQLAFWQRELAGLPDRLDLPTDRPRPAVRSSRGARASICFSREAVTKLRAFARRSGATSFMLLLATFEVLLARWSSQEDFAIGSPVANRQRLATEPIIGFFINTLALRADVGADPSFLDLVSRVRARALAALSHQDLPFERLVEELAPARDLDSTPLFQVMLALKSAPAIPLFGGLRRVEAFEIPGGETKFDLLLALEDGGEDLSGSLVYAQDLFDASSVERLLGQLDTLLNGALVGPDRRVSELPLLTTEERRQLLAQATQAAFPVDRPLYRLFEAVAEHRPDASAATFGSETLSYGELNRRANQVARGLRRQGVGPEDVVGLHLERSLELLAGLLGILKAGGGYLPIDPVAPAERVAFMLADSGTRVTLTAESLKAISEESGENLDVEVGPDHLAYVIYTSGSTGRPKGILIPHGNVVRLFAATQTWFEPSPEDVWTLFHSHAFDFSVWEIWGALLHGGRLLVVPYWVSRSPDTFFHLLVEEGVTVLNQTPSAFHQLWHIEAERQLTLRLVIFGGEALEPRSLASWFERHSEECPMLVNMYGITETTVHVTFRPLGRADLAAPGSPIGVPIPDLSLYVLDRRGEPVPVGMPGELHVGGAGLARGYLGRSDLTAEHFLPDPYGSEPGARLYRSGDLVRRQASGELNYLGRFDHQVKIRGFRIELGEIETTLAAHPDLREAVVLALGNGPERRLAAYVVPRYGADEPDPSGIRSFLQGRLPEYMLPADLVLLDALPLTPNGKVDCRALPEPVRTTQRNDSIVLPETAIEERIAGIWQQILRLERVGVNDNFFELGGHSLLAVQVLARVEDIFEIKLPLRMLFENPTIAYMAMEIERLLTRAEVRSKDETAGVTRDELDATSSWLPTSARTSSRHRDD